MNNPTPADEALAREIEDKCLEHHGDDNEHWMMFNQIKAAQLIAAHIAAVRDETQLIWRNEREKELLARIKEFEAVAAQAPSGLEKVIEWLHIDLAPIGGETVYGQAADGTIRNTWFEEGDWWYERISSELLTEGAFKWSPVKYGRLVAVSSAPLVEALEKIYHHTEEGELAPEETVVDLAQHVVNGRVVDEAKIAPTIVKWNGGIAEVGRIAKAALAAHKAQPVADAK